MAITKETIKALPFAKTFIQFAKDAFFETPQQIEIMSVLHKLDQKRLLDTIVEKTGRTDIQRGSDFHFVDARITEDGRFLIKVRTYQNKGMYVCNGYDVFGTWEIDVTDIPEAYQTYYGNNKIKDVFIKVLNAEGYCPFDSPTGSHRIVVLPF